MKFKARRDLPTITIYLLGVLLSLLLIGISIYGLVNNGDSWVTDAVSIIIAVVLLYIIFRNIFGVHYEIINSENTIYVNTGTSKDKIKFKEVKEVEQLRTLSPQGALAKDKIAITFQKKGEQEMKVYVATTEDEKFLEILKEKCQNAKFITPEIRDKMKQKQKEEKFKKK